MPVNRRRGNRIISPDPSVKPEPKTAIPLTARETAMTIVAEWLQKGCHPDRLLEELTAARNAAVQEIVYGAVKWRRTLQWRIDRVATRAPRRDAAALLLTAACELFVMTDSPAHAVVHETVAIARRRRLTRNETGFINAVLRGMLRDRATADRVLASCPAPLRLSHPDTLWQRWVRQIGAESAERLCIWNNERGDTVIRPQYCGGINTGLRERLHSAGIAAEIHPARPRECLVLPRGIRLEIVPGYDEGAFTVQDPATLMAVDMLAPQPGERVLDACAAPGGKTAVLADRMNGSGRLVALEVDPWRVRRLAANMARIKRGEVTILQGDLTGEHAALPDALHDIAPEGFDAILVDVPCSNTGVLRRRPDARWRFHPEHLRTLTQLQQALLSAAAVLIKPEGRIVYSTCSLECEENSGVIADWIKTHPEFRCDEEKGLFPPDNLTDGAYAARLVRRKAARI